MLNTTKRGIELARMAWEARKLGEKYSEAEQALARRHLVNLFKQARGVTMKVGQLFANSESDSDFNELVDNIEPLPLEMITPIVERALGKKLHDVFLSFDPSTAAASLGQVHRAVLLDGSEVAVKVRYPDIADAVEAEMELAGLMPKAGPIKKWGIDYSAYLKTLKQNMDQELNYLDEARRQEEYRQSVLVEGLRIPKVYMELCRENILVQSWEEGVRIDALQSWSVQDRQLAGAILLQTLLYSLFEVGLVHGDPHMGNYKFNIVNGEPVVVLMDFGCTIEVEESARLSLLQLIIATRENTNVSALASFSAMGFEAEKLTHINSALPMLCHILFRPFLAADRFRVVDWRIKSDIEKLLNEKKWWFRSAGPSHLLLLLRAFQGLAEQLATLKSFLPWWQALIHTVGEKTLTQARSFVLPTIDQELENRSVVSTLATTLHVAVYENNAKKASVEMPAEVVLDLKTLMPEDVLAQLESAPDI
ncbi:MAG: AarF/UbiB family protein, partial [Gammaproteobacteria bacterium]|nr:AarF/UbiB family protein [Gammaproteobacteria bacterium]